MCGVKTLCLVLLSLFALTLMSASVQAYYGYGHSVPTYGYTYGPVFNYDYFAGPIFGGGYDQREIHPYNDFGCPILCLGRYWRDMTRRRPIAVSKGNRILIR
jgi:hypothetical protein